MSILERFTPELDAVPAGSLHDQHRGDEELLPAGEGGPSLDVRGVHTAMAVLFLLTCAVDLLQLPSVLRCVLTLASALTLPGSALLVRARFSYWVGAATKVICLSVAVEAIGGSLMLWAHAWHPVLAGALGGALSAAVLAASAAPKSWRPTAASAGWSAPRLGLPSPATWLTLAPLALAVALWAVSVDTINASAFGVDGLVGQAPVEFFVGLGIVVLALVVLAPRGRASGWVLAGYVGLLLLYLYGTIPAVSAAPQYAWTYKHIGVTRLLMQTGSVHPSVDIYNRWPGMFAAAAWFSSLTKVDPLAYAGWAEFLFATLQAIGVAAIALRVSRRREIAALSALTWLITNWIGQTYFSPQAVAFLLDLGIVLIVLESLPRRTRLTAAVTRGLERVLRRAPSAPLAKPAPAPRMSRTDCALVLCLDVAAVISHQLTPYMVILQVLTLTILGLRPRWLLVALTAVTVAYLLPNLAWVQTHYGLFSGFDPISNASVSRAQAHRAWFYSHVGGMLSITTMLLGLVAAVRLIRVGAAERALAVGALALAPFALLFGNNYGGEGSLRVFLFASPWLSLLIGSALATIRRPRREYVGAVLAVCLAGLFLFAFIGNAGTNVIPKDEVTAGEYFYTHAPHGSVLMLSGEDFPLEVSPQYRYMAGPGGDHSPNLLEQNEFLDRQLGTSNLPAIVRDMQSYSNSAYLAFSTTENRYAAYFGTTPPDTFEGLERAVSRSPMFKLWWASPNCRIYRLVG